MLLNETVEEIRDMIGSQKKDEEIEKNLSLDVFIIIIIYLFIFTHLKFSSIQNYPFL